MKNKLPTESGVAGRVLEPMASTEEGRKEPPALRTKDWLKIGFEHKFTLEEFRSTPLSIKAQTGQSVQKERSGKR